MTINIHSDGRLVTISGKGIELLKAKSEISVIAGVNAVKNINRTTFTVPLSTYLDYKEGLECDVSEDSESAIIISNAADALKRHIDAKGKIIEIIESGHCTTGFDHWDNLLDPHQGIAANVMSMSGLAGMCLFDEQGTGKTISALAAFDILSKREEVDAVLILAPKTLLDNWRSEIEKFLPNSPIITSISGDKVSRYSKLNSKADIYLATYETLNSELVLFESLAKARRFLLIVDESFFVKNPEATRSISVEIFRRSCVRALILCGTPAPNSPIDLIHQFNLSDNGYSFGDNEPPKDPEKLKEYVEQVIENRGVYLRRTKDTVLPDLAEKKFHVISLDMQPMQDALYNEAKKELILFLKSLDNRTFKRNLTTYFQKRAALLQICISPKLIDHLITEEPTKYLALDELLNSEILTKGHKVVIWSVYTKTIDTLIERYQSYNPVRVDGKVSDISIRQAMVEKFQNDPNTMLFIGNPAAAGAGITLHASHVAVYISFSNQAAHYMQSLDRIHRRGQVSKVVDYYFLICKNTIEQIELDRLCSKQKTQADLLGDITKEEFSLEVALRELYID